MFPEERRQKLISALEQHYSMSVSEIAGRLGVSEATVRRDLNELQKLGVIRRTHGGALLASQRKFEPTYTDKKDRFLPQKQKIGRVAAGLVEDGETVISGRRDDHLADGQAFEGEKEHHRDHQRDDHH